MSTLNRPDGVTAPTCPSCGTPMKLFFREHHPDVESSELVAFECSSCPGPILTQTVKRSDGGNYPRGLKPVDT
jgi:hypothetical protein